MNINKSRKINTLLLIPFTISLLGTIFLINSKFSLIYYLCLFFAIVMFLLLTINGIVNNKCPECKKYRRKHPGKHCKFCGKEFDLNKEY